MLSVREATLNFLDALGDPAEIDVEEMFKDVLNISTLIEPEEAVMRCARQDFCAAYNTRGYYKISGGLIINKKCNDAKKLANVANNATRRKKEADRRASLFKQRVMECDGQMFFREDEEGNLRYAWEA